MAVKSQLSVALPNQPGELGNIMSALGRMQVNIEATTVMQLVDHLVLRLVPANVVRAKRILESLQLHVNETEVVVAHVPNEPGALGMAASRLTNEQIEIHYLYGTVLQDSDEAICVFSVDDPYRADDVLAFETEVPDISYATFEHMAGFAHQ